jgi:hypothetical protein
MNDPVSLACLVRTRLAYISHSISRAEDDLESFLTRANKRGFLNSIIANKKELNFGVP